MPRRTIQEYREPGGTANLEDDWIAEIQAEPEDLDYFLGLAQPLAAAGEEERARALLELYDGELEDQSLWQTRLDLLRRAGALAIKPSKLHRAVIATLEKLWPAKPNLKAMFEYVGLHRSTDEPAKIWDQVNRLQSLLLYDVGEVVAMANQGVGRVVEVNLPLETLKIDFEKKKGVTVGFRAAAKMLTPLPPHHLLRRKIEDPEALARLRVEQPAELLRAVLEHSDKALTGAEIRDMLTGVVSDGEWSGWWTAARKHNQVVASSGGRQTYRWERSSAGALTSIRKSFDRAPLSEQLEIFRKHAARDPELAARMAGAIVSAAGELRESEPGFAFEAWFALERSGFLPRDAGWSIEELIAPGIETRKLLVGLEDRLLRERALTMLKERRDDWTVIFREQFQRENDPRVLTLLAEGLQSAAPAELQQIVEGLVTQPKKAPAAFVWLAERAVDDEALRSRYPLRLLQQILTTLAGSDFALYRMRLKALVESGGTIPRLLPHLAAEQAPAAIEAVARCSALDTFHKEPLKNAILMRFPALREEASGALYATIESIEGRRREIRQLAEVDIPANRKAIEEARAMGDLRENFEYKSARERHEYLNKRLATLHHDLGRVRPIELSSIDLSEVRIGTKVELRGSGDERRQLTLLGPWESRPEEGVLSYESELGRLLLGRRVGDEIVISGDRFSVDRIAPLSAG